MRSHELKLLFTNWLLIALKDHEYRAFIRARLDEYELPVIDLTEETRLHSTKSSGKT